VIGAVLGVGIIKGVNTIQRRTLVHIFLAWFITPFVASLFALFLDFATHLRYIPGH
jgi:PiT family inorganic phosphate transporter